MTKKESMFYYAFYVGAVVMLIAMFVLGVTSQKRQIKTAYDEALDHAENNFSNLVEYLEELYEEELWHLEEYYDHKIELLEQENYYLKKLHNTELKVYASDYENYRKIISLIIEYYKVDGTNDFVEWLKDNHRYLYEWGVS